SVRLRLARGKRPGFPREPPSPSWFRFGRPGLRRGEATPSRLTGASGGCLGSATFPAERQGLVPQLVFKTSKAVQPTAGSVRLRLARGKRPVSPVSPLPRRGLVSRGPGYGAAKPRL